MQDSIEVQESMILGAQTSYNVRLGAIQVERPGGMSFKLNAPSRQMQESVWGHHVFQVGWGRASF